MMAAHMPEIVPVLIDRFLEVAPTWFNDLVVAVETGRLPEVGDAAHAYRSGALSIRAHRLAATLHAIEAGADRADERCLDLLPELVRRLRAVSEHLEGVRAGPGATDSSC